MNKVNKFNGFKEAGRVIERVIRGEDYHFLFYRKMIILSSRNVFPFPLFLLSIRRSKKFLPITDNVPRKIYLHGCCISFYQTAVHIIININTTIYT